MNKRIISEEEMTTGEEFIFGKALLNNRKLITWSPDNVQKSANAHLLIVGLSGTGKTRLLKKIIEYLGNRNKQVYVIDFHGDMETRGETVYRFTARNSEYGLSPFEFEHDFHNGGINVQAEILTGTFKKSFIRNLGAKQRTLLIQFIRDCYAYVGITDRDTSSWNKPIPTINTFKELFEKINAKIDCYTADGYMESFKALVALKKKLDKETFEEKKIKIRNSIDKKISNFKKLNDYFYEYLTEDKHQELFNFSIKGENGAEIDTSFYMEKENSKIFKGLAPYLKYIYESPVFNENKPPKTRGVVRYDISGYTNIDNPAAAIFFADIIAQRIFRSVKISKSKTKQGFKNPKANTFIVVDESRLVLPSGSDKDNPYHILNRITLEGRKFGIGLIGVSQRPTHFPPEMLSSIYTKVILEINKNDQDKAIKFLGVQSSSAFAPLETKGVAIIGKGSKSFESAILPWANIPH